VRQLRRERLRVLFRAVSLLHGAFHELRIGRRMRGVRRSGRAMLRQPGKLRLRQQRLLRAASSGLRREPASVRLGDARVRERIVR
jgi:hypothetical protein